ncbi:unnamed protein product [Calicophoron daubneyi]|uniref:N-acetylgalactosaminide beta-1,3-galactosyltransferase n=1 Tax=Calicophoron daubneyi TaxID=300641 RepID=A0AAV2TTC2_CALDB
MRSPTKRRIAAFILGTLFGTLIARLKSLESYVRIPESPIVISDELATSIHSLSTIHINRVGLPRVLCYVNTFPGHYEKKAIHVLNTWGRKCTKIVFTSTKPHPRLPVLELDLHVPEVREHLWIKMRLILRTVYSQFGSYDYFYKCDDDTYTVAENLYTILQMHSPRDAFMTGYRWPLRVPYGYFSGGAGYVLSHESFRRIVQYAIDRHPDCPTTDEAMEDVKMSICGHAVGVTNVDTIDSYGQSLFCPYSVGGFFSIYPDSKNVTDSSWPFVRREKMGLSDYQITFHYMGPTMMYIVEFLAYHVRPVGIELRPLECS